MLDVATTALEKGLGLKREHQVVLIRTFWVLGVSFHIAWVCGLTGAIGLMSPFARADDVDKLLRSQEVTASITMQQELRTQIRQWCTTPDPEFRALAYRRIYELRNQLREIAKIETPEPNCRMEQAQ